MRYFIENINLGKKKKRKCKKIEKNSKYYKLLKKKKLYNFILFAITLITVYKKVL